MTVKTTPDWIQCAQAHILPTYGRKPLVLESGQGCWVTDVEGHRYLDFVAGIATNALGHSHAALQHAMLQQASRLMHVSNLYWNTPQIALAERLCAASGLEQAFFCNSGAEANEAALKLMRKRGKQQKGPDAYLTITMAQSFHGRTCGALSLTAQPKYQQAFEPLLPGILVCEFNNVEALEQLFTAHGPHIAGVLIEPIQGEGGVLPATQAFLETAQTLCLQHNALLVFDEVQCGIGRTGQLFAFENFGIRPDVLILAKALGGGFPIGAIVAGPRALNVFEPGDHAATFGGNPLAAAVALAVLDEIQAPGFLQAVTDRSCELFTGLAQLCNAFPSALASVRGVGLMQGIVCHRDDLPGQWVDACRRHGLLVVGAGHNVLRLVPPLIITAQEVVTALELLEKGLADVS